MTKPPETMPPQDAQSPALDKAFVPKPGSKFAANTAIASDLTLALPVRCTNWENRQIVFVDQRFELLVLIAFLLRVTIQSIVQGNEAYWFSAHNIMLTLVSRLIENIE